MCCNVCSADSPRFIGDLEEVSDEWQGLQGVPIEIEGRASTVSRGQMRLQGSRLSIILPDGARPRGGVSYKLRGEMRSREGKTVFMARSLDPFPSDEERLRVAESRLKPNESDGWFELADEFQKRAKYYKDDSLNKQAEQVLVRGLSAVVAEAGDDPRKLGLAAKQAAERGFEGVAAKARHRMARIDWKAIQGRLPNERERALTDIDLLLDRMGRDLPGSTVPMKEPREALASAYGRDPYGVYDRVDAEQRKMIARILYAEIVEAALATQLLPNESNADAIADQLAARLPDRPDLAAAYRARAISSAMASIGTMSENDLDAFVKRLQDGDQSKLADKAINAWLKSRLDAARKKGPTWIYDVGEDYIRLRNDEETAVALFQEALEVDSRLIAAERALKDRGFEKVAGKWRKKRVVKQDAPPPGVKVGEVRNGMTDSQVRGSLRTAPDRVARIASFGEVTEVWIYEDFNRVITFKRRTNDQAARVVEVGEIN